MMIQDQDEDPTGNKAFVKYLVDQKVKFPPREVESVAGIYGGFSQSTILLDEKFTGEVYAIYGNGAASIEYGNANQSALYSFSLDNGHGLSAQIFGDGRIIATILSEDKESIELNFNGLVEQLNRLDKLGQGPFYKNNIEKN